MSDVRARYAKLITNAMYDVQNTRIRVDNRIKAFLREGGVGCEEMTHDLELRLGNPTRRIEQNLEADLAKVVSGIPIIAWLDKVKGIGPRYKGTLVGMYAPIDRFEVVSAMWSYSGMGVKRVCLECKSLAPMAQEKARFLTRQAERRWELHQLRKEKTKVNEEDFTRQAYLDSEKKLCHCDTPEYAEVAPKKMYYSGLLVDWNPFMRMTCWKIAGQFVKQGAFYRTLYDQYKEYYLERDCISERGVYPTVKKGRITYYHTKAGGLIAAGHVENRARRAMVKIFLSHLWEMWRKSEGLPTGEIYLQHKLGAEFAKRHILIKPPYADIFEEVEVPQAAG